MTITHPLSLFQPLEAERPAFSPLQEGPASFSPMKYSVRPDDEDEDDDENDDDETDPRGEGWEDLTGEQGGDGSEDGDPNPPKR